MKLTLSGIDWVIIGTGLRTRRIVEVWPINVKNSTVKTGTNEFIDQDLAKKLLKIWQEDLITHACYQGINYKVDGGTGL